MGFQGAWNMIDGQREELVPLTKAGRLINPSRVPHTATVWRWALHGVRGEKLESVIVGGQRFTSREAISRFLNRLNEPNAVPEPPNKAAERAGEQLRAMGV